MNAASGTRAWQHPGAARTRHVRLGQNLALSVGVQTIYVALLAAIIQAPLGIAVTMLVVAAFLSMPMLPVYLAGLALIPTRWPRSRKRLAAVAWSPVLLALYAVVLGVWIAPTGLFLLLVALPALVRLRDPRSACSSAVDRPAT